MSEVTMDQAITVALRVLRRLNDGAEPYAASVTPMARAIIEELEAATPEPTKPAPGIDLAGMVERLERLFETVNQSYQGFLTLWARGSFNKAEASEHLARLRKALEGGGSNG